MASIFSMSESRLSKSTPGWLSPPTVDHRSLKGFLGFSSQKSLAQNALDHLVRSLAGVPRLPLDRLDKVVIKGEDHGLHRHSIIYPGDSRSAADSSRD